MKCIFDLVSACSNMLARISFHFTVPNFQELLLLPQLYFILLLHYNRLLLLCVKDLGKICLMGNLSFYPLFSAVCDFLKKSFPYSPGVVRKLYTVRSKRMTVKHQLHCLSAVQPNTGCWNTMNKTLLCSISSLKEFHVFTWKSLPLRMQPISWFLTWANICCFSIGNQVFGNKSTSSFFFSFPYPFHFFFILTVHAMDGGVFGDKAAEGYQGWVLNARWYCILLCKNFCLNLAIALQTDYNNRMGKVYIPSFYYPLWSMRTLFKLLTYVASVFTSVTGQDFFHWRHFFVAKSAGFGLILYIYIEQ